MPVCNDCCHIHIGAHPHYLIPLTEQADTSAAGELRMSNLCSDGQLDLDLDVKLGPASYVTFRLNFHRFDRFELDLRGHTQP